MKMSEVEKLQNKLDSYFKPIKLQVYIANNDENIVVNCCQREVLYSIQKLFTEIDIFWTSKESLYGKVILLPISKFRMDKSNYDNLLTHYKFYFSNRINHIIEQITVRQINTDFLDYDLLLNNFNNLEKSRTVDISKFLEIRAGFDSIIYQ